MNIILAITAASGSIYGRELLRELTENSTIKSISVIFSSQARAVAEYEKVDFEELLSHPKVKLFDNSDMFAAPASGSAMHHAMIIAPCSAGTLSRIANGISDSLITRAADVQLKERRKLIVLLRETPLSSIHLRNMLTLSECGAVIMPASPSFYNHPSTIQDMACEMAHRTLQSAGIECKMDRWG